MIPEEAQQDWPEIDRRVVIPTHGENLQVSQAAEAEFDALKRLSSNDALLVAVQIGLNQTEAEFPNLLTGLKDLEQVTERDFGIIYEELFQIAHTNNSLTEGISWEPVAVACIKGSHSQRSDVADKPIPFIQSDVVEPADNQLPAECKQVPLLEGEKNV